MFSNSFARVLKVAATSLTAVSCFELAKTEPQGGATAAVDTTEFARTPSANWSAYASDSARTKYSPLDQINAGKLKNAKVVWHWSVMSSDLDLGLVYLPTTTPSNDYYGGDNLFAESIVCLDCARGFANGTISSCTTDSGITTFRRRQI